MNRQPFIYVSEFNISHVKNSTLAGLLNWIGKNAKTKRQFLTKYNEYSFCCSKERWLRFVKDVSKYNGLVYDEDWWSRKYDDWELKGRSYSIHFNF